METKHLCERAHSCTASSCRLCAVELVRLGADGIGCADADGDAPITVAAAHGGAQGWATVAAILEAEAVRMGVPEPDDASAARV